ncbi:hypothetical protein [Nocardiopsis sp. FIRDI 009]|uniref:hypothetical protein n=1 Tax=Nocardiopsis sp. FIRDI 009 TaxID=714197 RepID=UPI0013005468|nr:hypothetical protein [Nocardiopsis sp. FIRDI 009]
MSVPSSRVLVALGLEARTHARRGTAVTALALALVWTLVVLALPPKPARTVAGLLLFLDTAGFGVLFVAVLMLGERNGVAGAAVAVGGTALLATLLCAVSVAACASARDLADLTVAVPLCLGPLLAPPLLVAAGAAGHPALYAVPTTAAHTVVRWGLDPSAVPLPGTAVVASAAVAVVATAGACAWARWSVARARTAEGSRPPWARARGARRSRGPGTGGPPVWILTRVDLRGAATDGMVWALVAGPVVVALGLRAGLPLASDVPLLAGAEVAEWRPVLLAALVLLHVPTMAGSVVALWAAQDRERGTLALWAASPLGTGAYLAWRAVAAAGLAAVQLAVALPLSGLVDDGVWSVAGAVPVAGLLAAALALAVTAVAPDRVRALVVLKGVGALFVLVPVAVWVLPQPWSWFLFPLPVVWPLAALPAYGLAPAPLAAPCGAGAGALLVAAAWRWARAAVSR